jgi:hypothetical protein
MQSYKFSPIGDEKVAQEALIYIHDNLRKLAELVLDEKLPINTLKIFAHYDKEYDFLYKWINSYGNKENEPSGSSYYVKPRNQLQIADDPISFIGVRVPDPYRSQVGCGDFVVSNLKDFEDKYLGKTKWIRRMEHPQYEMMELFHPDIDVLGYIIK